MKHTHTHTNDYATRACCARSKITSRLYIFFLALLRGEFISCVCVCALFVSPDIYLRFFLSSDSRSPNATNRTKYIKIKSESIESRKGIHTKFMRMVCIRSETKCWTKEPVIRIRLLICPHPERLPFSEFSFILWILLFLSFNKKKREKGEEFTAYRILIWIFTTIAMRILNRWKIKIFFYFSSFYFEWMVSDLSSGIGRQWQLSNRNKRQELRREHHWRIESTFLILS